MVTPSQRMHENGNSFKKVVRHLLYGYLGGLVFYSILQAGKIPFHSVRNFIYRYYYCDRVWLGPRVIVLPSCTIGEGACCGESLIRSGGCLKEG